jgi:hypothetical protein
MDADKKNTPPYWPVRASDRQKAVGLAEGGENRQKRSGQRWIGQRDQVA